MLLDERNEFADATSVVAVASTVLIGDVINLKPATTSPNTTVDIENSELYLVIQTDTEIITGGSAGTLQFKLASDAQAAIAVDGSATDHIITPSYVTDDAAANSAALNAGGVIYCGKLPAGSYEQYLGILAVIGTTDITAGKINAFLTKDPARYRAYADNVG